MPTEELNLSDESLTTETSETSVTSSQEDDFDAPLGQKGEKALNIWKQRAKEAEMKLKVYQDVDVEAYQQLKKEHEERQIITAEKEKNWEKLSTQLKTKTAELEKELEKHKQELGNAHKQLIVSRAYYQNYGLDVVDDDPVWGGKSGFQFIYEQIEKFIETNPDGSISIVKDNGVVWLTEDNQPLSLDGLIKKVETRFPMFFNRPKTTGTNTMVGRNGKAPVMTAEEYLEQRRKQRGV